MTTNEERISRLEGSYEHVATKADVERSANKIVLWMVSSILLTGAIISGVL